MGLREILRLPKRNRKVRSKTRSEISPIDGPSNDNRGVPRPADSTPDLGIGRSTLPPPAPFTSPDQESKGHSDLDRQKSVSSEEQSKDLGSSSHAVKPSLIDQSLSNLKPAAKLILRGLHESADACSALKSVTGCLNFIRETYENAEGCRETIDELKPRTERLNQTLSESVPEGEVKEERRRKVLKEKLDNILKDLQPMADRGKLTRFLNSTEDMEALSGMVEDIRDAVMEYQTSLQQDIFDKACRLVERADSSLLRELRQAAEAGHRSGDRKGCMKGTRKDVLLQIENWLNDEKDKRVFWLNGLAGTGKSTIAQTFAETSFADGKLGASFFCSRAYDDRSSLRKIFPTLAFQLAYRYPRFREQLLPTLEANPDIGRESLCSQMEKLIVHPLQETQITTLIIIDALDECRDEKPESALLSLLSRYLDDIPFVKFFITGRPESHIRSGFRLKSLRPQTELLRLHGVERSSVDSDIRLFFKVELAEIGKNRSDCDLPEGWPASAELNVLCAKAAGLFIYASTVVRFVGSKDHQPAKRLVDIISLPHNTAKEGRAGIDQLYTEILQQAFFNIQADDEEFYSSFRSVVGTVVLVSNPLSVPALGDLLGVSNVSTTLRSLHSLIVIPTNPIDPTPIHALHQSFPDFLTDPQRCKDKELFIDPLICHRDILLSCLKLMKGGLGQKFSQFDQIGDSLGYACCFWASHLAKTVSRNPDDEKVCRAIDEFFKTCFLSWVEVLSLMNSLDGGLHALNNVDQWYNVAGGSCEWTSDSKCFLLENFDIIHESPSHVYYSALPFCPAPSWLRKYYNRELSKVVKVIRGIPAEWGICTRTVLLDHYPTALSYKNNTFAVGLDLGDIIIFNSPTGSQEAVFTGHRGWVWSLVFSSDGGLLVSGSEDKTIRLWDMQTGGIVDTLCGHTGPVKSVSISVNCTRIASGSEDKTICLWDIQTRECHCFVQLQHGVDHVGFSPTNAGHLISIANQQVQQWDSNGQKVGSANDGYYIVFSSDNAQFALCNEDAVTVQNSVSGAIVVELHLPDEDSPEYCCFSPDGSLIAVSSENTVYIWNISLPNPQLVGVITIQLEEITSIVFSSPSFLISASHDESYDGSVKFWQTSALSADSVSTTLESTLPPSDSNRFVSLQVSKGIAISGDSTGVVKTWSLSTGLCQASFQTPAPEIYCGDAQLIDDRLLFIWGSKKGIHIWHSEKGEFPQTLEMFQLSFLRISEDGSKLFALSKLNRIQVWSMHTWEHVGAIELGEEQKYCLDSFHASGSKVWVYSPDHTAKGWDFRVPHSPILLFDTPSERPRLEFTNGSLWGIGPSFVEDTETEEEVFRLPGRHTKLRIVRWDGRYMIASYDDGEILILDFYYLFS